MNTSNGVDQQNQNNNSQINPPLHSFLESCLYDKGIEDIPEELKESMIEDLGDRLQKWLMQSVFMHLPSSAAPEMEQLIEQGASQEEIMQFLQGKITNINKIFEQEMVKFKEAYLGK